MKPATKTLMSSILQFIVVLLMIQVAVLAWFTLTDTAKTNPFFQNVGNVELSLELYVYRDTNYLGSTNITLEDNVCLSPSSLDCYELVSNPTSSTFIPKGRGVVPNDKFSFALKVMNNGDFDGYLSLSFSKIQSLGYNIIQNKVQRAYSYTASKIVYVYNDIESADFKDNGLITYAGMNPFLPPYFLLVDMQRYTLATEIFLAKEGFNSEVIIFFELFFDPEVSAYDLDLNPTGNSNAFQNQLFIIERMTLLLNTA